MEAPLFPLCAFPLLLCDIVQNSCQANSHVYIKLQTKQISFRHHIRKEQGDATQTGHGFAQRSIVHPDLLDLEPF